MNLVLKLSSYYSQHLKNSALSFLNPNTEIYYHELHRKKSIYLETKEIHGVHKMGRTIIASSLHKHF